mmetsp:Transcript_17477/g.29642  ORF Transcript_17477/g.29642 Transcript_17477/m.29642 type:complete len:101 (-) Transcript_17477:132-434(-)
MLWKSCPTRKRSVRGTSRRQEGIHLILPDRQTVETGFLSPIPSSLVASLFGLQAPQQAFFYTYVDQPTFNDCDFLHPRYVLLKGACSSMQWRAESCSPNC